MTQRYNEGKMYKLGDLLSPKDVAELTGKSVRTIRNHLQAGRFPDATKVGQVYRIPYSGYVAYAGKEVDGARGGPSAVASSDETVPRTAVTQLNGMYAVDFSPAVVPNFKAAKGLEGIVVEETFGTTLVQAKIGDYATVLVLAYQPDSKANPARARLYVQSGLFKKDFATAASYLISLEKAVVAMYGQDLSGLLSQNEKDQLGIPKALDAGAYSQPPPQSDGKNLTVDEAAAILRVAPKTVYRYIANDQLKGTRFGGAVRVTEGDLKHFIEQGKGRVRKRTNGAIKK